MVTNLAYLFLIFIANGILIGLLFDFFRILRRAFKTGDILTYIEDFLFWILTGISILYTVFVFNNGEIRLFLFIGVGIGIITYMIFFSSYVIKFNVAIINFLKKIFKVIFSFFSIPLKFIYKIIKKIFYKPISFITNKLIKNSTSLYKNIIKITNIKNKNVLLNKKIQNNVKN